jgi:hypothetical protein
MICLLSQIEGLVVDESYFLENEKKRKDEIFENRLIRVIQLIEEQIIQEKKYFGMVFYGKLFGEKNSSNKNER